MCRVIKAEGVAVNVEDGDSPGDSRAVSVTPVRPQRPNCGNFWSPPISVIRSIALWAQAGQTSETTSFAE